MGYAIVAVAIVLVIAVVAAYVVRRRAAAAHEPGPIARRLAEAEPDDHAHADAASADHAPHPPEH